MSRKPVLLTVLIVVLIGTLGAAFDVQRATASGTIYIRANGLIEGTDKITSADNITYTFSDDIYDSIIIERSNIVIDGEDYTLQGTGSDVGIWLSGIGNVTIRELEIREFREGIYLDLGSSNNRILENLITTNGGYGVAIRQDSNGNTVSGNSIAGNTYGGIYLEDSSNNTISGNSIAGNNGDGIDFHGSHNNSVSGNSIAGNDYGNGIGFYWSTYNLVSGSEITGNTYDGIYFEDSSSNTISGNSIAGNGGDGVGFYGSHNNSVSGNSIAGNDDGDGVGFYGSHNNTISGNSIAGNNGDGIGSYGSAYNSVSGSNITGNTYNGIYLEDSNNNTISGNTIANNNDNGILLWESSNNRFFHNNLTDNSEQVVSYDSTNFWDDGYPSGGNYWSDYEERYPDAEEIDGSGLWDTPYVIDENNQDNYPIIPEFPSFLILPLFMIATLLAVIVYRRKHSM